MGMSERLHISQLTPMYRIRKGETVVGTFDTAPQVRAFLKGKRKALYVCESSYWKLGSDEPTWYVTKP